MTTNTAAISTLLSSALIIADFDLALIPAMTAAEKALAKSKVLAELTFATNAHFANQTIYTLEDYSADCSKASDILAALAA